MFCAQVREALSARLDGEPVGEGTGDDQSGSARLTPRRDPDQSVDRHLAECAGCRAWLPEAERVTRAVRVRAVEVPDLTAQIMNVAATVLPRRSARTEVEVIEYGRRQVLRWAVALGAAAQLLIALPVLLGGLGVVDDPHASREMASLDIALAVGFAFAAYRPQLARAYVPVALVLAVCLCVTSAIDIVNSTAAVVHEVGHLAAVVQAGLLWALGRTAGGAGLAHPAIPGIAPVGPAARA
jgi:predicted anti-sigma-YlaC factor YlaD